ncbi:AraC family transcriptional regulator [Anaeromyxobacter paludicola]|uniref:AraC family transcriptional regulator n=1 Tax=Anaeromyxobacter paludicola TaxID=2918171 RepID=A0ABM7XFV4_9BACT|nr:AraC family transcriptional regulator ligand-binding domain-containing protein [Anaeromyxobacter paludicola]BDG10768.1 AraC family transcriptional regulator [Anaeromyxobacter paludicola]
MSAPDTFAISPRVFARAGIPSLERLCERAGVAPSAAFRTDEFFRLWAAAEDLIGDPAAGLRLGAEGLARGYGVGSTVALHAPDLRGAVAALARYKRLTCPERVELELEGDDAIVRYRWLQATREVPRLLVDTTTAALRELASRGTAGRVQPVRLELARRPRDRALLQRHFGCPVVFAAPHDALVFERGALDVPFVTADGGAFARIVAGLERRLRSGEGFPALVGEVRVAIARQLSEGRRASLAGVARRLAASARTLQRRLEGSGTSFHEQLATVRRTTATRLLANTELDPVAISMLLGFVEPNSFARAFRAWERTTPLRWRAQQGRA